MKSFQLLVVGLSIFLSYIFSSCTDKQTAEPDTNPIKIQTNPVGNVSMSRAVLSAEINYLNDEKILDQGFIISEVGVYNTEIKVSLGQNAKPGLIKYDYVPKKDFEPGASYQYIYYLETDQRLYATEPRIFQVKDFWVDQEEEIFVTLGDTLTLTGNFKQLSGDFSVGSVSLPSETRLPVIRKDDTKILLYVPSSLGLHEQVIDLDVIARQTSAPEKRNQVSLARIKLLGKIEFFLNEPFFYSDLLKLRIIGVSNATNPLLAIIGGHSVPYSNDGIILSQLPLIGTTHRVGYFNGIDTLFSDRVLELRKPDTQSLSIESRIVHPGESLRIGIKDFERFFPMRFIAPKISWDADFFSEIYYQGGDQVMTITPNLTDGKYSLAIDYPIYGKLSLPETVKVQALKHQVVNEKAYYYGDEITVGGDFRADLEYMAMIGQQELFRGKATGGTIKFKLVNADVGLQDLLIGFYDGGRGFVPSTTVQKIQIDGGRIDDFYPRKGYAGDIITLKGPGVHYFSGTVIIADVIATRLPSVANELKFILPPTIRKGSFPIKLMYNGIDVVSSDKFELL